MTRRLIALAITGLAFVALAKAGIRLCPTWWAFGVPCPGCGMVRAVIALASGHFAEAWELHPLVYVAVPVAALEAIWTVFRRLPPWRYPRWVLPLAAFTLFGTWAGRLLAGIHPDGIHLAEGAFVRAWVFVAGG